MFVIGGALFAGPILCIAEFDIVGRHGRVTMKISYAHTLVFATLATATVLVFAVTNESLWLDEYITYAIADKPGLAAWIQDMLTKGSSDIQKPVYHLYMFFWVKLAGLTEISIRQANGPWLLAALTATAWAFRHSPKLAMSIIFASAFHPLIWFYVGDAQTYAAYYSTVVICVGAIYCFWTSITRYDSPAMATCALTVFYVGIFLLCGTTLLGVPWAASLVTSVGLIWRMNRDKIKPRAIDLFAFVVFAAAMLMLGAFYLFTLLKGAGATTIHETNLLTIGFSTYEVMGLGGLGPGRDALRNLGPSTMVAHWPTLTIAFLIFGTFLYYSLHRLLRTLGSGFFFWLLVLVIAPILFTIAAGYLTGFRVLGRHLMPVAAAIAMVSGFGLWTAATQDGRLAKLLASVFAVTYLAAAASYSAPRHDNEDFRSASKIAAQHVANGELTWWSSMEPIAEHYGLQIVYLDWGMRCFPLDSLLDAALIVRNVTDECAHKLAPPDIIILSRPDANDRQGSIVGFATRGAYDEVQAPKGFRIWSKTPSEN